jgi:limonene-1,2-epoxide hydrolase
VTGPRRLQERRREDVEQPDGPFSYRPRMAVARRDVMHFATRIREGAMSDSNESVLREVIASWGNGLAASAEVIRKHFADDCVWVNPGFPTTTGPEEAAGLLDWFDTNGFTGVDVEFRNVAAVGDVVFTERVDWLVRSDGTRVGPLPVTGVTEFRDGKISGWREYADTAPFEKLMSGGD